MKSLIAFIHENTNNHKPLENFSRYPSLTNLSISCSVISCFCIGVYTASDADDCIFFVTYKLRGNPEALANSGRVVSVYALASNHQLCNCVWKISNTQLAFETMKIILFRVFLLQHDFISHLIDKGLLFLLDIN